MITKNIITLVLTAILFVGCNKKEENSPSQTAQTEQAQATNKKSRESANVQNEQKQKNEFDLQDTKGKSYHVIADYRGLIFDKFKGKVLVLDFFATWCPPCRAEIPHLINLQKKYKDKGVQFISILMERDRDNMEIEEFAKSYGFNYPIMNSSNNVLLSQALGGIQSLPTLVIFNRKGEYYAHFIGAIPEEMLAAKIDEVLSR